VTNVYSKTGILSIVADREGGNLIYPHISPSTLQNGLDYSKVDFGGVWLLLQLACVYVLEHLPECQNLQPLHNHICPCLQAHASFCAQSQQVI
jgi:hypothetical protein